jgi:hypothetical protein
VKKIAVCAIAVFLLWATPASAQVELGLNGGVGQYTLENQPLSSLSLEFSADLRYVKYGELCTVQLSKRANSPVLDASFLNR